MLDLRALVDASGSTSLASLTTIATNDGTVVAGTPALNGKRAQLAYLSFDQLVAGTPFVDLRLLSQDIVDPQNGLDFGQAYAPDNPIFPLGIEYKSGNFVPRYDQTAGARLNAGLVWYYPGYPGCVMPPAPSATKNIAVYDDVFAGALTAGAWGEEGFTPNGIKTGSYAILGWALDAITSRALIRFSHSDWGSARPGLPSEDANVAITRNISNMPPAFKAEGMQFAELSREWGVPLCPVFTVTQAGTGLNVQMLSNTADTPVFTLYLHKIA